MSEQESERERERGEESLLMCSVGAGVRIARLGIPANWSLSPAQLPAQLYSLRSCIRALAKGEHRAKKKKNVYEIEREREVGILT